MATTKKKPAAKKPAPARKAARATKKLELTPGLSTLEARFAVEFIRDMNGTQAYLRCRPDTTPDAAKVSASRMLTRANVQAEIARLAQKVADDAGIDAVTVVRTAWQMMTADPRELSEVHLACCRHCWGRDHRWQRTDGELEDARSAHRLARAKAASKADRDKLGQFDERGGGGFDVKREPNPACPSCGGAGDPRTVIKDTRHLSPAAVQIFAGVKQTKDGIEVKMHSKDAALDKMFRHFGLYNDKIELTMPTAIVKDMTGRKD